MKKTFLRVIFLNMILYILQFIMIPLVYNKVFGRTNEGGVVLIATTIIITATGMFICSDKMRLWLLGIVVYAGLILIYCPKRIYGVGRVGFPLYGVKERYDHSQRFFQIAVIVAFVIILQFLVWCFVKLVKLIVKLIRWALRYMRV